MVRNLCLMLALAAAVATACSWDHLIWIPRDPSADPLYRFIRNGKAGYIDAKGKVVIEPKFETFGNRREQFVDGVMRAYGYGYVDKTGATILKDTGASEDFADGLAAVRDQPRNLWGFIDRSGNVVIPPKFPGYPEGYLSQFADGFAAIETNGLVGYVDKSGSFVIPPRFLHGGEFRDEMAVVVTDGPCYYWTDGPCSDIIALPRNQKVSAKASPAACKFTFTDKTGKLLPLRVDQARHFSDGLAPVRVEGKWGYVDKSGLMVIAPRFPDAQPFSNGLARVGTYPAFGYIDKKGTLVIPIQYKRAEDFHDNLAPVSLDDGTWFYIDKAGRRAIPDGFAIASPFFKGLAHVREIASGLKREEPRFAYIDTNGKRVFEYTPGH